jgi:hypothetical protein
MVMWTVMGLSPALLQNTDRLWRLCSPHFHRYHVFFSAVKLTTYLHLAPMLRMGGVIQLSTYNAFMVWTERTTLMDFMLRQSPSLNLTVVYVVKTSKGMFISLSTTCCKVLSPASYFVKKLLWWYGAASLSIRVASCRITPCLQSSDKPILFSIFVAILHRCTPPRPSTFRIKESSSKWDKIMQHKIQ